MKPALSIEITNVRYLSAPDAYEVTAQDDETGRRESVLVSTLEVKRELQKAGAMKSVLEYEQADLVPMIAQLATPDLALAFKAAAFVA